MLKHGSNPAVSQLLILTHFLRIDPDASGTGPASYEWLWHLYPDAMTGKVISANGSDFFQFSCEGKCLVDIKLSQLNGYTLVELTQHEIPTDYQSKQYVRLGFTSGWAFYLMNLKSVYEAGIDLRKKEQNLPPMINN